MRPFGVPAADATRLAAAAGAGSPSSQSLDDVVVELLAPEQSGIALAQDAPLVLGGRSRQSFGVKLVGFLYPSANIAVELGAKRASTGSAARSEPQPHDPLTACRHVSR